MRICKKCGNILSKAINRCPECKTKAHKAIVVDDSDTEKIDEVMGSIKEGIKKEEKKHWFLLIIIMGLFVAAVAGYLVAKELHGQNASTKTHSTISSEKKDSEKESKKDSKESKKEKNKISYDNYLKINIGDSYSQVVSLFGKEGQEVSSTEVDGVKTTVYSWQGTKSSDVNVSVQNDQVISKTQMGLKNVENKLTLEKYNQVVEGMTYEQVKEILGEGQIFSQSNTTGSEVVMYQWMNKDGSNANLTFREGALIVKAQFNLK